MGTPPSYRNAGRYTIYYRAEQNGWYPYYGQAELLIGRAGLTVVPLPDQEKFTGQADPELRYTYRGAIPGKRRPSPGRSPEKAAKRQAAMPSIPAASRWRMGTGSERTTTR